MEGDNIIGLADVTGGGAISLEPGGQFELSGAPVETVHQTASELFAHLAQVREVAGPLGIGFLGLGMTPNWSRAEIPMMPKGRYKIMTAYMPKVGKLRPRHDVPHLHGADEPRLLLRSRHGEKDARRAGAAAGRRPRCSPTRRSPKASPTASCRSAPRSGATPTTSAPACCRGCSSPAWASSATPTTRSTCRCISSSAATSYIDVSGKSFRDHLAGKLDSRRARHDLGLGQPRLDDLSGGAAQALHRDARLRRRAVAAAAGAAGVLGRADLRRRQPRRLLGDREGLDRRGAPETARRRAEARLQGDDPRPEPARHRHGDCCGSPSRGSARRKRLDRNGRDETRYLRPLQEIVARGITPAEELLEKYHGRGTARSSRSSTRCVLSSSLIRGARAVVSKVRNECVSRAHARDPRMRKA